MIPYFAPPVWMLGPVTVRGFGVAATTALLTGYFLVLRRAESAGVPSGRAGLIYGATVTSGLLASQIWNHGAGISSTALVIGALICFLFCAAFLPFWRTLDLFAYPIPITFAIARVGCFMVHDHVGIQTGSWLAVQFPDGPRYDLGLLYSLAAGVAAVIVFVVERFSPRAGVLAGTVALLMAAGRLVVLPLGQSDVGDYRFANLIAIAAVAVIVFRTVRTSAENRLSVR